MQLLPALNPAIVDAYIQSCPVVFVDMNVILSHDYQNSDNRVLILKTIHSDTQGS